MRRMTITAKYLVIDTETTGLDPHRNGLIQCAALALDRELDVVAEYNVYICPPDSVIFDEESSKIHNIPIETIKNGLTYTEFAHNFIDFIAENFNTKPILIGQFFAFDYGFLSTVFDQAMDLDSEIKARLKAPDNEQYGLFQSLLSRNFIDTKSLASSLNLKAELISKPPLFQETSLSKVGGLKDTLMIPQDKFKAHDALGDCYATREVLIKMMDLLTITNQTEII
jgi:DNA polymerase III epsilon subunit-like protein